VFSGDLANTNFVIFGVHNLTGHRTHDLPLSRRAR